MSKPPPEYDGMAVAQIVEKINAAGGNAKLTTFHENSHDSWTAAYANPELYDWMLSKVGNH